MIKLNAQPYRILTFSLYYRTEAVEQQGMLRTKEMRERELLREKRKYRYTLIRIRFPDGLVLQVKFKTFNLFLLWYLTILITYFIFYYYTIGYILSV